MKALVLGAAGQLGSELVGLLGPDAGVAHARASITDARVIDELIAERKPDVVFNCAAYNAVDRAEDEPAEAISINRDGAANVAVACARHGARLLHFSTNFVFDGRQREPYVERDPPHPLGAYGLSKLAGEGRVLQANPGALVVRTAAVYGTVGAGFPERIVERARAHGELEVVSDQRVNPTYARDLAVRSVELAGAEINGIVHLTGEGCCSWNEFALAVLEELDEMVPVFPLTSDQLAGRARRPANGCLGSARIPPLRPWREALREWAAKLKKA